MPITTGSFPSDMHIETLPDLTFVHRIGSPFVRYIEIYVTVSVICRFNLFSGLGTIFGYFLKKYY